MRWGLVSLLGGMLLFTLGIVVTALCLLVVAFTWTGRAAPPGSEVWFFLAGIGGVICLVGALVLLFGVFLLASIPAASGAGRWASWGVVCLPVLIAILASRLWVIGDPQAGEGHVVSFITWFFAMVIALFCWTLSINHILQAAAKSWGDQALRQQFQLCFIVAWCFIGIWVVIMAMSSFSEVSLYPGPVVLLGQMSWHLFLLRRLLQRIPPRPGAR